MKSIFFPLKINFFFKFRALCCGLSQGPASRRLSSKNVSPRTQRAPAVRATAHSRPCTVTSAPRPASVHPRIRAHAPSPTLPVRRGQTPGTHAPAIPYCVGTRNIRLVMEVPNKTLAHTLGVNARCVRHRDSSGQALPSQTLPVAPTLQWYSPKNSYSFSQAVGGVL